MTRRWKVIACLVVLFGVVGWLALQMDNGVRADPKKTRPCGDSVCSVNELCCFAGCPAEWRCLPRRVGKCPPPYPCPPPASTPGRTSNDEGL